ncbi:MAG TPA: NAD(P)H-hydrate epimerase, partial [Arachnia sp.]|nr:NAD(P)H-hydrate epimerase [Arachnia sp.]
MRTVITAADMREAERLVFAAEPGVDLMGRAAAEVARVAGAVAEEGPVLVVAGPGNNGGDGLYAAAIL